MADASRCIFIQVTDISIFFRFISVISQCSPAPAFHSGSLKLIARVEIFFTPDLVPCLKKRQLQIK